MVSMCFDAIDVRLERVPVELSVYRGNGCIGCVAFCLERVLVELSVCMGDGWS